MCHLILRSLTLRLRVISSFFFLSHVAIKPFYYETQKPSIVLVAKDYWSHRIWSGKQSKEFGGRLFVCFCFHLDGNECMSTNLKWNKMKNIYLKQKLYFGLMPIISFWNIGDENINKYELRIMTLSTCHLVLLLSMKFHPRSMSNVQAFTIRHSPFA